MKKWYKTLLELISMRGETRKESITPERQEKAIIDLMENPNDFPCDLDIIPPNTGTTSNGAAILYANLRGYVPSAGAYMAVVAFRYKLRSRYRRTEHNADGTDRQSEQRVRRQDFYAMCQVKSATQVLDICIHQQIDETNKTQEFTVGSVLGDHFIMQQGDWNYNSGSREGFRRKIGFAICEVLQNGVGHFMPIKVCSRLGLIHVNRVKANDAVKTFAKSWHDIRYKYNR